ncbi:Zinc/iron permease [Helicostylum pulchrum]|uniref:Uncharacterized protein n=1 Tax=Helicostylum pulchrum TaxID=562976 RepID=A0ABP9XNA8_9FUNG|nr:Zinc/iron permease [Helicostylum pulchrum]
MESIQPISETNMFEGWLGVLISSTACVLGASIVFLDKCSKKSFLDSRPFMASSMALASGVLLFSSLAILFPQAQKRLDNDALLYTCYFGGATFTLVLTKLIHYLMPDAIHACGDAAENCHHADEADQHEHHDHPIREERRKLTDHACDVEYGAVRSSESHFRFHHDDHVHEPAHTNQHTAEATSTDHHNHNHNHHNHHRHESVEETVTNDPGHFYSIGLQTAIAICVHKFPEGLIMFVSSQASSTLGLSVCIAMSIHNLTEGFMIALPLYYATRSRSTAFSSAAVMGGLSQPLGALIGLFLIQNISKAKEDLMFGIVFGSVSGMMSLITIQSMLPQAVRADDHGQYVLIFFFLGIFLVGLSSVLESI